MIVLNLVFHLRTLGRKAEQIPRNEEEAFKLVWSQSILVNLGLLGPGFKEK